MEPIVPWAILLRETEPLYPVAGRGRRQKDKLRAEIEEPSPAQGTLIQTLDALNKRFGRGAVKVSTQGAYSGWQMRQARKSPNYTTDWAEVPVV